MKAASYNQKNGGHRKSLCPGAPQGPPRYHHQRQFNLEYRRASSGRSCRPEFLYSARIPLKIKAKETIVKLIIKRIARSIPKTKAIIQTKQKGEELNENNT